MSDPIHPTLPADAMEREHTIAAHYLFVRDTDMAENMMQSIRMAHLGLISEEMARDAVKEYEAELTAEYVRAFGVQPPWAVETPSP